MQQSAVKRILIIQGHPDAQGRHFGHALTAAYIEAAKMAGHEVQRIDVATLDFPLLRSKQDWEKGAVPESIRQAQQAIVWANHLLILYPLWLGEMPALLKGFFEQVLRPGFAIDAKAAAGSKRLGGRSARIVVTMGMPAPLYRWYFRAHGLKVLQRNILGFVGIAPIRASLIGSVETGGIARAKWIARLHALGTVAR